MSLTLHRAPSSVVGHGGRAARVSLEPAAGVRPTEPVAGDGLLPPRPGARPTGCEPQAVLALSPPTSPPPTAGQAESLARRLGTVLGGAHLAAATSDRPGSVRDLTRYFLQRLLGEEWSAREARRELATLAARAAHAEGTLAQEALALEHELGRLEAAEGLTAVSEAGRTTAEALGVRWTEGPGARVVAQLGSLGRAVVDSLSRFERRPARASVVTARAATAGEAKAAALGAETKRTLRELQGLVDRLREAGRGIEGG
jgi:hypothetical protein